MNPFEIIEGLKQLKDTIKDAFPIKILIGILIAVLLMLGLGGCMPLQTLSPIDKQNFEQDYRRIHPIPPIVIPIPKNN